MIARFRALLPFMLSIRHGDQLPDREFAHGPYHVRISRPVSAMIDAHAADPRVIPLRDVIQRLVPAQETRVRPEIKIDGQPTDAANLVQIEFRKDRFDRTMPKGEITPEALWRHGDPSTDLAFKVLNGFLATLRTLVRGPYIEYATPKSCFWRLDYLNDDGAELTKEDGLYRFLFSGPLPATANPVYSDAWKVLVATPPEYIPPTWDTLVLDAYAALPPADALIPQVGTAIVLAYAALETFVAASLNELSSASSVPADFWQWLLRRGDDLDRQPSVEEKFDQLLRHFTGRSLKEETGLWTAFKDLRNARNKFVHEGIARIGDLHVSTEKAKALVVSADEIIDWVEKLLPEPARRPKLSRLPMLTFTSYG